MTTLALPEPTSSLPGDTTTIPVDAPLPGSFGTLGDLTLLVDMFSVDPLNAQIVSSFGLTGEEDEDLTETLTITYHEGMTVWEFPGGYREVSRGDESFYLDEDGMWRENDRFEWPPMGPFYEWDFVQPVAHGCIEAGAEIVGLEQIAGVTTLHIRCAFNDDDRGTRGSADVWIGESGHVIKSVSESWVDPSVGLVMSWEVIAFDVVPGAPLPPDW